MRALEVYYSTGITISEWNKRSLENSHHKDSLIIGLDYKDRNTLYDRIEMRVDSMIKAGLLEETERLIKSGLRNSPTAGQAIGYKEFYPYFDGQATLEECIETLKKNTRHYAKRQLTWFRRNPLVKWIYRDCMSQEEIFSLAQEMVNKYLSKEDTQHNELDV